MEIVFIAAALAFAGVAALRACGRRLQRSARRVAERAADLRAAVGTEADAARRAYDAAVRAHNSACSAWPAAWVARWTRCRPCDGAQWYWQRRGGAPQGPEPPERLLAMRLDGRLGDDVVVALAGSDEWQPVGVLAHRLRRARGPLQP